MKQSFAKNSVCVCVWVWVWEDGEERLESIGLKGVKKNVCGFLYLDWLQEECENLKKKKKDTMYNNWRHYTHTHRFI